MKKRDVKQMLLAAADRREIGGTSGEVLARVSRKPKASEAAPVKAHKSRTWMIPAFSAVAVAVFMMIALPAFFFRTPVQSEDFTLSRAEEVFSLEMLALAGAVDGSVAAPMAADGYTLTQVPPLALLAAPSTRPLAASGTPLDALANEIHRYLQTARAMVEEDTLAITYERNDGAEYTDYYYRLAVKFENGATHTAYYNESRSLFGRSFIEGVFVMDGIAYEMTGEREVERDEVEMELRIKTGRRSHISVSNERAVSEYEYAYTFVENGREQRSVAIEVSNEGAAREVSLEITEGRSSTEYEFTYAADRILCEYEKNEREHELVIFEEADRYRYVFDGGTTVEIAK